MLEPLFIGVDLGGTQMRMAAINKDGHLLTSMFSTHTGKEFSPEKFEEKLRELFGQICVRLNEKTFAGIGLGITGIVDENSISQADFLPLLNGVNIVESVHRATGLPARIENDARCFVLAEARFGAARGLLNVVGLTLGTGVGGGVIVDGKLLHGARRNAGEVWGIPLRGKWMEYFVSGYGIAQRYKENSGAEIDAAKIAELARGGDQLAIAIYQNFAEDLWGLCETIRALLDPEIIVIGGSLAQARDVFGDYFIKRLGEKGSRIAWAELGTAAGVIGAAALQIIVS